MKVHYFFLEGKSQSTNGIKAKLPRDYVFNGLIMDKALQEVRMV